MRTNLFLSWPALLAGWLLLGAPSLARAANYSQTNTLYYGWNAIWLEVEPRDTNGYLMTASQVFTSANYKIDQVAAQSLPVGTKEFSTKTNANGLYNQPGWTVWSSDSGSGETGTITVRGNRAYLLHVSPTNGTPSDGTSAGAMVFTGGVEFHRPQWQRGNWNLIGFSVTGHPTFASLLGAGMFDLFKAKIDGSPLRKLDPETGTWVDVAADETAEAGRAYWAWAGLDLVSADYAGPVAVNFDGALEGGLYFGATPPSVTVPNPSDPNNPLATLRLNPAELTFSCLTNSAAHTVSLTKLSDPADRDLQLFHVQRVPDQLAWQTDPAVGEIGQMILPSLQPGQSTTITLGMNRNWSTNGYYREQLYRIDVILNPGLVYYYLPVSALNPDVPSTNAPVNDPASFAGLWVGTVTANGVTSLTDSNRSVQPTASRTQLRVLIHVDTNGAPVLLSRVMHMQKKTAADSVSPEHVLILDEAQIPYYEGIQERGGKKVGIRYETVGFDMPRDYSTNGQSTNFLQRVAGPGGDIHGLTDQAVENFLAAQPTRPPDLQEVYHDRWKLDGRFGPGNTLRTFTNAPLRLDAFHRTNPFRHAYHPQHGAGYDITRTLTLRLDAGYQTGSGRLSGTYEETTTGLSTVPLVARGTLVLQRASGVQTLQ